MISTRANRIQWCESGMGIRSHYGTWSEILNLTEVVYGCSLKGRTAVLTALRVASKFNTARLLTNRFDLRGGVMQATDSLSLHFTRLFFCSDRGIQVLVYAQWCEKCQLGVLLGLQRWACASC